MSDMVVANVINEQDYWLPILVIPLIILAIFLPSMAYMFYTKYQERKQEKKQDEEMLVEESSTANSTTKTTETETDSKTKTVHVEPAKEQA